MTPIPHSYTAIVLAGSRASGDPVAEASGVSCKALTPIGNTPMIFRVLEALHKAETISERILCGPSWPIVEQEAQLESLIKTKQVEWIAPQSSPSTSAAFVMKSLPESQPLLVTTADHALLTSEIVDFFCSKASKTNSDVVAGLVPSLIVEQAFPGTKRTIMKFKDQGYCGCNLFAFLTPKGRAIADFWRQVEQERKSPLKLIRTLGWIAVLQYVTGNLTLAQGLHGISQKLSLKVTAVQLPFPQAAVDVDTVADLDLVQDILKKKEMQLGEGD